MMIKLKHKTQVAALFLCALIIGFSACEKKEVAITPIKPTLGEILPIEGLPSSLVTIKGAGLSEVQKVTFSDVVASFNPTYNTESVFMLRVPADAKYGKQKVTVYNKGGEDTKVEFDFTVSQPPPIIDKFTPAEGAEGEIITISGKVFDNLTGVKFGDLVADIVKSSTSEIQVKVPKGVEKKQIEVTTPGGSVKSKTDFTPKGAGDYIFDDAIIAPWEHWGWGRTFDEKESGTVKVGSKSIKVKFTAWSAHWFHLATAIPANRYKTLKFWIHGGSGVDKKIRVFYNEKDVGDPPAANKGITITAKAGAWTEITLNVVDLGSATTIKGFFLQESGNAGDPTDPLYIDDVKLLK